MERRRRRLDLQPHSGGQLSRAELFSDHAGVRAAYGQSIQYTMSALVSFVQHYGDKNLVLVVLGDHQPAKVVSGESPTHNVPISIIAHDPAVLDRISGWGWDDGLRPSRHAPLWHDERLPRSLPQRVRLVAGADSGRSSVCAPRRAFVAR